MSVPPIGLNEYALALLAPTQKNQQHWKSNTPKNKYNTQDGNKDFPSQEIVTKDVEPSPSMREEELVVFRPARRMPRREPLEARRIGSRNIRTLEKAAQYSNDQLIRQHSPYRMRSFEKNNRLFLELSRYDEKAMPLKLSLVILPEQTSLKQ